MKRYYNFSKFSDAVKNKRIEAMDDSELFDLFNSLSEGEFQSISDRFYSRFIHNFNTNDDLNDYQAYILESIPLKDLVYIYKELNEARGDFAAEIFSRKDADRLPNWFIREVFFDSLKFKGVDGLPYTLFEDPVNPEVMSKLVKWFYDYPDPDIRYCIANSSYTPVDILRELANDEDEDVRKEAREKLRKKV